MVSQPELPGDNAASSTFIYILQDLSTRNEEPFLGRNFGIVHKPLKIDIIRYNRPNGLINLGRESSAASRPFRLLPRVKLRVRS
ncbi:unnamed protein product [Blepharisma stoltei]|uniref:Uncharacterized protein n=1 Tax=Blepharisma stoltei TaxID=1481888 RepID=A0AAU9K6I3_9CILI|nr:unnamed protein product [Blepharisma stoltei]